VLTSIIDGIEKSDEYAFVKKANRNVYFTDGVKTHTLTINEENGKKKGFEYSHYLILTFEGQPTTITYYCIVE
jgi:hypothetical protein